jgi:RNA polymerase sigma factor (sigma-70 family)
VPCNVLRVARRLGGVDEAVSDDRRATPADAGFDELYRAEWPRLVRLALALTGSRAVAEDVVHDAFVRLAGERRDAVRPPAYLRAIVVNLVRDRYRHARVEARHVAPPPGVSTDPEIDETWWALQRLPERYRNALVLRFYADLSVADVAALLGCRPGTAKSLIHRGLRLLKERLS